MSAEIEQVRSADANFITQFVGRQAGVLLDGKDYLLSSRLTPVARHHGLGSVHELVTALRLAPDPALTAAVIDAMTTHETSFFRDGHPFRILSKWVIPRVLEATGGRGPLTIWSGAASSGQEALSVAMMISEEFAELARPGRTRILATDVSPAMVQRCKELSFNQLEIGRGLPPALADKYFEPDGSRWHARAELRTLIEARLHNLIGSWKGLPRCDLVMLRNVLIYFDSATKGEILRRIRTDVLKPGGCLILGASETTLGFDNGYDREIEGNSTLFIPRVNVSTKYPSTTLLAPPPPSPTPTRTSPDSGEPS